MLSDLKEMLMEQPNKLVELLEKYDYAKFKVNSKEVRFARSDDSESGLNISIHLNNNPNIFVTDYVYKFNGDVIAYIMKNREVDFRTVLSSIKSVLGLGEDWQPKEKQTLFGGFYDRIGEDRSPVIKTYDESVLDDYINVTNLLWIKDGIDINTQRKYDVRFDIDDNRIVFPWRDANTGRIMAIKGRYNGTPPEGVPKYIYPLPGNVSLSLFNYAENYESINGCDRLFIFEGEKSCMLADKYGYGSSVALGSHNLSTQQAKLIIQANPKEIVFLLDKDLEIEETMNDIETLKDYAVMQTLNIKYWNWKKNKTIPPKGAPIDCGKAIFEKVLENELEEV